MKQAIIIRKDLKMGKGKIAAQAAHASIGAFLKARKADREEWLDEGMKKVVLRVDNLKELKGIHKLAKSNKIPCDLIKDAGLTQVKPRTTTALGIGPASDKKIDRIVSKLKLL
jgi:PTH2 family peptidyl-tRNA hydrolase